jgi:hypothetical protein
MPDDAPVTSATCFTGDVDAMKNSVRGCVANTEMLAAEALRVAIGSRQCTFRRRQLTAGDF